MHLKRDIDRYLAEGLPAASEQQLRQHLRLCAHCRGYYDEELRLRQALAGAPGEPTRAEQRRLRRLVLERAGLAPPEFRGLAARSLRERFVAQPWRFAIPAGAAALALLIGLWFAHPWSVAPTKIATIATQREIYLSARVTQAKDATVDGVPLKAGAAISAGATVAVASAGVAELELVRGGRARLFPGTRLKLTPGGEVVALDDGKVWCDIEPKRGRFAVHTDRGEARVLGTSFVVEKLADGDADVRVLSGVVEVEDLGHRGVVRVKEGQRTRLMQGAAPARASHYDAQSDRMDWEQAFRKLGREVERTLRKLGDQLHLP